MENPQSTSKIVNWIRLTKPYMWIAIGITVLPGLFSSGKIPGLGLSLIAFLGTVLIAISSFVFNQIWEQQKDAVMTRTRYRPLVTGIITEPFAYLFAFATLLCGSVLLYQLEFVLPLILALLSFLVYVFLYTILLKPTSAWCTVVGGFSGAVGPLVGQSAVSGGIDTSAWVMFILLFVWQPPHFWVLAMRCRTDYQRAGIQVLPNVLGVRDTWKMILGWQLALLLSILLGSYWISDFTWFLFALPSFLLGSYVLYMMWKLFVANEDLKTGSTFKATILHMLTWHIVILLGYILELNDLV